jgi:hypothetical protein
VSAEPAPVSKQLICPSCGVVVADATHTRWPGNLVLVAPDGRSLMPESVGVLLRRAEAERRDAASTVMPHLVRAVRDARGGWADPS